MIFVVQTKQAHPVHILFSHHVKNENLYAIMITTINIAKPQILYTHMSKSYLQCFITQVWLLYIIWAVF